MTIDQTSQTENCYSIITFKVYIKFSAKMKLFLSVLLICAILADIYCILQQPINLTTNTGELYSYLPCKFYLKKIHVPFKI